MGELGGKKHYSKSAVSKDIGLSPNKQTVIVIPLLCAQANETGMVPLRFVLGKMCLITAERRIVKI